MALNRRTHENSSYPARGDNRPVSWRTFLFWGLLMTTAGLPLRYGFDRNFRSLADSFSPVTPVQTAETSADTLGYAMHQAITNDKEGGSDWVLFNCRRSSVFPPGTAIVFPDANSEILIGYNRNGNKSAISAQSSRGDVETCSLSKIIKIK